MSISAQIAYSVTAVYTLLTLIVYPQYLPRVAKNPFDLFKAALLFSILYMLASMGG